MLCRHSVGPQMKQDGSRGTHDLWWLNFGKVSNFTMSKTSLVQRIETKSRPERKTTGAISIAPERARRTTIACL